MTDGTAEQMTTENSAPPQHPTPVKSDRHMALVERWNHESVYRAEVESSQKSRKPRLPSLLIKQLANADVTFEDAMNGLRVTRSHLRGACIRTGIQLEGGPRIAKAKYHGNIIDFNEQKGAIMPAICKQNPCAELNAKQEYPPRKRFRRGHKLAEAIRIAVRSIEEEEGVMPSFSRLTKEFGFSYKALKKYCPKLSERNARGSKNTPNSVKTHGCSTQVSRVDRNLVQMVSEIVYGADLVPGTYIASDGAPLCDSVVSNNDTFTPLVQAWRQREFEVIRILETARDLSGPTASQAAPATAI
ncbi:hypothetical protein J2Y63_004180 [Shinella sp. BE166]|uniref:hypothetical protein n=1 Tax=Shinella sp. BE166 TaxID=3373918 RepID=UPI003EBDA1FA